MRKTFSEVFKAHSCIHLMELLLDLMFFENIPLQNFFDLNQMAAQDVICSSPEFSEKRSPHKVRHSYLLKTLCVCVSLCVASIP